MLSFLSPLFLAGAAAAAIPIVLHLLKREPEARVKFSAVKLLKAAPVENTERRRLRELLLLAMRIAALVLLALAFARPFFASGSAHTADTTVVALDTSYSMSGPDRFARAQQLAKEAIRRAPAGGLVAVVTFSDEAAVAVAPTADRTLAESAVDEAAAGFGATRYRAALSAASQALAGRKGTIVVVTDLQEGGWDAGDRASIPEGAQIEVADVGAPPADLAVVDVRPMSDRVVATVRNTGTQDRQVRARLTIDGRAAGEATVAVSARQSADVTFAVAPRGEGAAVTVDDPGGIAADDTRFAVLGGVGQPTLLVVTGSGDFGREGFYVQHALAAGGAYRVVGASGAQLSSMSDDQLATNAAVVVLSTRGLERRGREAIAAYARSGGGVLVAAGTDVDGDVAADVLGAGSALEIAPTPPGKAAVRTLAPADVRHPVFRAFAGNAATFGVVRFDTVAHVSGASCDTLARFTTGEAALLECAAGDGRALVLASDLDNRGNDFPLHAAFVPFLHEVIRYLSSVRAHASEYLVADAPAASGRKPGITALAVEGRRGGSRRIAVNVDPREAEPARMSVDEFQSAVTTLKEAPGEQERIDARQQEDRQHLWQYVLAAMVLLLAGEGALASRTA